MKWKRFKEEEIIPILKEGEGRNSLRLFPPFEIAFRAVFWGYPARSANGKNSLPTFQEIRLLQAPPIHARHDVTAPPQ